MRSERVGAFDHVKRPIIALGRDCADGYYIEPHSHRRGQLMTTVSGLIELFAASETWIIPPGRGVWIPPGSEHSVRMVGAVRMQNLYLEPEAIPPILIDCQVVGISTFMRSLITEALSIPVEYDLGSRSEALMNLVLHEMQQLPKLPLSLPYPMHDRLSARCHDFMGKPNVHQTIDDWCQDLGMSRRAFTRLFKRETGHSFVSWRQQACLLAAMPLLAAGQSVTSVALDLGYENPAAFTIMFKRAFGSPPLTYLGLRGERTAPAVE